ncbi:hypothetical protein K2X33_07540 [bacterium]|nr:hypothetical protein [bacterium]
MGKRGFVLITDRGGHLHNARMLLEQLGVVPEAILTTPGPELEALRQGPSSVYRIPQLFSWIGKRRFWNPLKVAWSFLRALWLLVRLRPQQVISLGASNVVPFCYLAKGWGAKVVHVECMNQVHSSSVTGRMLYPICDVLYVQWPELLSRYGSKARYSGWVLGSSRRTA